MCWPTADIEVREGPEQYPGGPREKRINFVRDSDSRRSLRGSSIRGSSIRDWSPPPRYTSRPRDPRPYIPSPRFSPRVPPPPPMSSMGFGGMGGAGVFQPNMHGPAPGMPDPGFQPIHPNRKAGGNLGNQNADFIQLNNGNIPPPIGMGPDPGFGPGNGFGGPPPPPPGPIPRGGGPRAPFPPHLRGPRYQSGYRPVSAYSIDSSDDESFVGGRRVLVSRAGSLYSDDSDYRPRSRRRRMFS